MKISLAALLGLAAGVVVAPTLAQEQLETVSVVGHQSVFDGERNNSLANEPITSTIVGAKVLQTVKFQQPEEILQRVAGVSLVRNLRIPISEKSYTVPLIDGLALGSPYNGSISSLREVQNSNIERIEVVKGPSRALYPSNAFGGTINVVTKMPPQQHEQSLSAELGSYQRSRLGFEAAGTVDSNGYFFDVSRQRMEGYRDGYQDDRDQLGAKGLFELNERTRVSVAGQYIDRYERLLGDLTEREYQQDPSQAGIALGSDEQVTSYFTSLAAEYDLDARSSIELSLVYRNEDASGIDLYVGPRDSNRDDAESKLVYQRDFDTLDGELTAGASYIYGRSDFTRFGLDRDNQIDRSILRSDALSHTNIQSFFADYVFSPVTGLQFSLGVRREDVDLDNHSYISGEDVSAEFSSTDPKLGLTLSLGEHHSAWLGYSEGAYVPNTRQLYTDENANPNLKAEHLENRELGLRGSWQQGQLNYSISYFEADISDYIVIESFASNRGRPERRFSNAGLLALSGVELDMDYRLFNPLSVALAYTYADNRYQSYVNPYTRADLSGEDLSTSPDHHLNLRLLLTPMDGLQVELEWDAISTYYTNDDNDADPDGNYNRGDRLNLRARYQTGAVEVWFHALNLTSSLEDQVSYSRGQRYYDIGGDASAYAGVKYTF